MKVVLDTNVLLVSLPHHSKYHLIFEALTNNIYSLCISNDIYLEYLEIILQKANPAVAQQFIDFVYRHDNIEVVDSYYRWNLIANDPDDNKFSDCAVAAKADYLVTNDLDFNVLKELQFPRVSVITIDEFLSILTQ